MPAVKGQKFKQYSYETKMEAIRLHLVEGWTYRRIMEKFGMTDRHRLKDWMKKYKESGEFGLIDHRGRREEYVDQDRQMRRLKRENEMLKKCLEIWMQEMKRKDILASRKPQKSIQ
ncbi:transposase [Paenibacillus taichungensis]|jgi:transposase-like protein|uniref:transposase n=1 Tax=Paenibacillus taichungensis TaxID=484184 RepID=UPI0035D720AC